MLRRAAKKPCTWTNTCRAKKAQTGSLLQNFEFYNSNAPRESCSLGALPFSCIVSIQSPLTKAAIFVVNGRSRMKWLNHVVVKQDQFLYVPHKRAFSYLRGHMTEWIPKKINPLELHCLPWANTLT